MQVPAQRGFPAPQTLARLHAVCGCLHLHAIPNRRRAGRLQRREARQAAGWQALVPGAASEAASTPCRKAAAALMHASADETKDATGMPHNMRSMVQEQRRLVLVPA